MNPDQPLTPREELEIRITALLMGQLPAEEAAELQAQIAADPELSALHARLKHTVELLREARTLPEQTAPATPLQLSKERREKLLATFRGIKPLPTPATVLAPKPARKPRRDWSWPISIGLAASIVALVGGAVVQFGSTRKSAPDSPHAEFVASPEDRFSVSSFERSTADPSGPAAEALGESLAESPSLPYARGANGYAEVDTKRLATIKVPEPRAWTSQPGGIRVYADDASERMKGSMSAGSSRSLASDGRKGGGVYLPSVADKSEPLSASAPQLPSGESHFFGGGTSGTTPALLATDADREESKRSGRPANPSPPAGPQPLTDMASSSAASIKDLGDAATPLEADSAGSISADQFRDFGRNNLALTGDVKNQNTDTDSIAASKMRIVGGRGSAMETVIDGGTARVSGSSSLTDKNELEAPDFFNKEMTPQHRANVEEVKEHFIRAKDYKDLGRNDLALMRTERILKIDKDNIAAKKLRDEIYETKDRAAAAGYDAARSQAMFEVTREWERPYRRFDNRTAGTEIKSGFAAPQIPQDFGNNWGEGFEYQRFPVTKGDTSGSGIALNNDATQGKDLYWDTQQGQGLSPGQSGGAPANGQMGIDYGTPLLTGKDDDSNGRFLFSPGEKGASRELSVANGIISGDALAAVKPNNAWGLATGMMDLNQPVLEPHAISEPLSTAGKINLNTPVAPFDDSEGKKENKQRLTGAPGAKPDGEGRNALGLLDGSTLGTTNRAIKTPTTRLADNDDFVVQNMVLPDLGAATNVEPLPTGKPETTVELKIVGDLGGDVPSESISRGLPVDKQETFANPNGFRAGGQAYRMVTPQKPTQPIVAGTAEEHRVKRTEEKLQQAELKGIKDAKNSVKLTESDAPAKAPDTAPSGKGAGPSQDAYVSAFLKSRKAEELESAGDMNGAREMYRGVADTLSRLQKTEPDFQPEMRDWRLKRTMEAIERIQSKLGKLDQKSTGTTDTPAKVSSPAPVPQPEIATKENAFSTFSLNVSDVSFKLASASLEKGSMPEPGTVRSEEFINALNYRDPEPTAGAPLAFASERARYPFAHNRDLLRLSVKTAAAGREPGRPLNLVLLLDNSGSMERADRVRILKESLRVLTTQLKPQDKLSIITFSRTPRLWADGVSADKAAEFTQRVGEITPQGGTDLSAAMDLGYQTALKHYHVGSVNRVVLLTDGAANLGDVKAEALKEKVETHRKQGVAFDCFGVGWEGYNDDLLEQLSRNGDGRYGFINTPEAAATEFAGQLAGALRVAASDVKVQVEFNPRRVTAYRQLGYAKHQLKKEQFRDNTVDAAEIGAAESGNALYAIEVNPRGEGDIATVRVRFKVPGTADYREHEWTVPFAAPACAMEESSSSLRLAATAAAFSEWLVQSPFAAEVSTDRLLGLINGIPAIYGADPRPAKLEWMIRQAKSISGR